MNYKCLIVDDEPLAQNVLESYIAMVPSLELTAKCGNAFEAIKILHELNVDVIFLDIQMPQLSGIDFIRSLRLPPKIIFTTAYKEFALEGFDLDAVDYLLKPISLERFIKAINKIDARKPGIGIGEEASENKLTSPFFYFRVERKMVKVLLQEIIYVESLKDYVKIIREGQLPLIVKQTIGSLDEMLPRRMFVRIHRSFIVSIDKVKSFTPHYVEIKGTEIPVGRLYQQHLKSLIQGV
jgi:DNA-binding LytR/AlgR family response regulator